MLIDSHVSAQFVSYLLLSHALTTMHPSIFISGVLFTLRLYIALYSYTLGVAHAVNGHS